MTEKIQYIPMKESEIPVSQKQSIWRDFFAEVLAKKLTCVELKGRNPAQKYCQEFGFIVKHRGERTFLVRK